MCKANCIKDSLSLKLKLKANTGYFYHRHTFHFPLIFITMYASSVCKIKESVYYSDFITITNTCDNQFIKEKGLFELTALEFESVVIWPCVLKRKHCRVRLLFSYPVKK